jgi:5,10-methylenetetrahydromethanopterin reductase
MQFNSYAVGFSNALPVQTVLDACQLAEAAGCPEVWLAEVPYYRSGIALATNVALKTKRIRIALGVISPFTEHPVYVAMEAATLQEISNNRLILGVGPRDIEGRDRRELVPAFKESIIVIRDLLEAKPVSNTKAFKFASQGEVLKAEGGVKLFFKPSSKTPIYAGVVGAKMLEVAGQVADGVLLGAIISPGYVKFARNVLLNSMSKAGRKPEDFTIASYIFTALSEDRDSARSLGRKLIAQYAYFVEPITFKAAGISDEDFNRLRSTVRREGPEKGETYVTDQMLDQMMLSGTLKDVEPCLKRYLEAGLQVPVPFFYLTEHFGTYGVGVVKEVCKMVARMSR